MQNCCDFDVGRYSWMDTNGNSLYLMGILRWPLARTDYTRSTWASYKTQQNSCPNELPCSLPSTIMSTVTSSAKLKELGTLVVVVLKAVSYDFSYFFEKWNSYLIHGYSKTYQINTHSQSKTRSLPFNLANQKQVQT